MTDDVLLATQPVDVSESAPKKRFNFLEACALNTLNMFGTGPFITIPVLITALDPAGPHALVGYAVAAIICINDSFVWAELGSLMPRSGGSYTYLRELFGERFGRFISFMFVWQFLFSGPLEVASGFVAMSSYLTYITGNTNPWVIATVACGFALFTLAVLYYCLPWLNKLTVSLWIGTLAAIGFVLGVGFSQFNRSYFAVPSGSFSNPATLLLNIGYITRFGIYDFTGYYDVNWIGSEVKNPRWTIPRACVTTCIIVCGIYFAVYAAVLGYLPYMGDDVYHGFGTEDHVMSSFAKRFGGEDFAIFFTLVVVYTIFGSCFSLLVGYSQIPYVAARDGEFYSFFARENPKTGLPDNSILLFGLVSALCCFLPLDSLIDGMLSTRVLVQFIGQAIGDIYYRQTHPDANIPFPIPFYPLPNLIVIFGFAFVYINTDNYLLSGGQPILESSILFLIVGALVYFLWWGRRRHHVVPSSSTAELHDFVPSTPSKTVVELTELAISPSPEKEER